MWPLNRIVVVPEDGAWALPCDWGCGGNGHPTGAFVARSTDAGGTWAAAPTIPGIGTDHLCPEPGMALVNDTTMFAVCVFFSATTFDRIDISRLVRRC